MGHCSSKLSSFHCSTTVTTTHETAAHSGIETDRQIYRQTDRHRETDTGESELLKLKLNEQNLNVISNLL